MLSTVMDAGKRESARGLSKPFAGQQGIQPILRQRTDQRHRQIASRDSTLGLTYSNWSTMLNTPRSRESRCW
jgi:hypothetical protein